MFRHVTQAPDGPLLYRLTVTLILIHAFQAYTYIVVYVHQILSCVSDCALPHGIL